MKGFITDALVLGILAVLLLFCMCVDCLVYSYVFISLLFKSGGYDS